MDSKKIEEFIPWMIAGFSGLLLLLSFPPFRLWPIVWIALVPLNWAIIKCPNAQSAANLGGFTGLIFYCLSLFWLDKVFGVLAIAFWCIFALWIALYSALIWRIWNKWRYPTWSSELLFVALAGILWAGLEYFRSEVWWLNNSWLSLGYSQTPNLSILQSCSLWGVYGLSSLIASANAAWILAIKKRRCVPFIFLGLISVVVIWGRHRTNTYTTESQRTIKASLIQDESYNLDRLSNLSQKSDADLVVWPEYSFTIQPDKEEKYLKLLVEKLRGTQSMTVVGSGIFPDHQKKNNTQNFAWVLSPEGKLIGRYDKLHPIPYVEKHLTPNTNPHPVSTYLGNLGIQICYDLDFENGTRKMVRQGAQLLVVPNLDPIYWGYWQHKQHSDMSSVRSVESGLWLIRAASSGYSQIIDPLGRVISSMPPDQSGVLSGKIYLAQPATFYSVCGWLFGPICTSVTGLILVYFLTKRCE